jgi:hypothetical protein
MHHQDYCSSETTKLAKSADPGPALPATSDQGSPQSFHLFQLRHLEQRHGFLP